MMAFYAKARARGVSTPALWLAFLILVMIAPAQAQSLPEPLTLSEQARVIEIIDADTIVLEDGRQVRLVGLQGPKLALGRPNFEDWPLAHEAAEFLAALVLEREIGLAFGETPEDRHGRLLAHIVRS